jgi:hypothetical protein
MCWAYTARCLDDGAASLAGKYALDHRAAPASANIKEPLQYRIEPSHRLYYIFGRQDSLFVFRTNHTHIHNGM